MKRMPIKRNGNTAQAAIPSNQTASGFSLSIYMHVFIASPSMPASAASWLTILSAFAFDTPFSTTGCKQCP
ncbi:hypothetical protein [Janthinobacterium sp. B9-8]|uniref:hypothetical protein n=1 Tax=Janthinobacterium sp. B9-8 TaxID=1236179 RepID=UPI00061CFE2D|nr:hypothetical protein [Janthinobacterium sp. B9-8]AMC34015.1 hypothetical protein VN23_05105 [Janthinobacterium sp. B9-8]